MMMKKKAERNGAIEGLEWEMRPGGMLVQKRTDSSCNQHSNSNPYNSTIKIRVKHNKSLHEIQIDPRSSFGKLKKMLEGATGASSQDQKVIFKEKERDSNQFLDIVGVKDGSTLVLMENLHTKETNAAMKSVMEVSMEVDKLRGQVSRLKRNDVKGVAMEKELLKLTEMFMSLLIKLDGIVGIGDVKLQRKAVVIRVQRYIDRLDRLKAQNEKNHLRSIKLQDGRRKLIKF